ncbi:histidine kinase [Mucilaginibacter mali]|uniref:Histidine kinase n=1 Tax=Mucilaginibacter mali TaxID=2740462 RepID=A0A7D4PWD9_9SPHI|nr:histidine kinase [Mucilaginibacter mali]QKJ31663.1 histidine kinase [Mucilaginibacter mali]
MRKVILLVGLLVLYLQSRSQNPGTTFPAQQYRHSSRADSAIEAKKSAHEAAYKAIHSGQPVPFGNKIAVVGEYYADQAKEWSAGNVFQIQDNNFYLFDKWLAIQNPRTKDSLRKLSPNNYALRPLRSKILLGVKLNPMLTNYNGGSVQSMSKGFPYFTIRDSSAAVVYAMGVNPGNVKQYRYHAVLNDSTEIVPWSVPQLVKPDGATQQYGFIGRFAQPGKQVIVEVVNTNDYNDRAGILLDWHTNHDPEIIDFSGHAYNMSFSLNDTKRGYSTKMDKHTNLPLDLKFPAKAMESFSFRFKGHLEQPYNFILLRLDSNTHEAIVPVKIVGNEYEFRSDIFKEPGRYEILITVSLHNPWLGSVRIPFTVLPPLPEERQYTAAQLKTYAFWVVVAVIIILAGVYVYSKQKVNKANRQKAMAGMRLNSIQSQLNPHFMFNALTSIQNLVNQHDMEGANNYLSKFAGLTRQVLNTGGKELISLEDELHIIEDYLQIEQLRFGFAYTITIGNDINRANTEIPAMLLQPFIENAAKHGVSALKANGKISISIKKDWQHLLITIADNGPGFGNTTHIGNGIGLQLTDERIDLLNQIYKDQPIDYKISSKDNGATITITLTNWA